MHRRTVLRAAGGLGVGTATLSGCLGAIFEPPYLWTYDVDGDLDAVADGTVYVREASVEGESAADGELVALDAATGERQWGYGGSDSGTDYTPPVVENGVFVGECGDCVGLYALEPDGEERWTRDVPVGDRGPVVADGVVYVASSTGDVRAVDATTGDDLWAQQIGPPEQSQDEWTLLDATDAVYLATETSVIALEPEDGTTRWRYDRPGYAAGIVDGVVENRDVYARTFEGGLVVIADGAARWHWPVDQGRDRWYGSIVRVTADRLYVNAGDDPADRWLYAFDVADGDLLWRSDEIKSTGDDAAAKAVVTNEQAYLGMGHVRAIDLETGEEHWRDDVDAPVRRLRAANESMVGASLVVQDEQNRLVGYDAEGERTWHKSVSGTILDLIVADRVYVATGDRIGAFAPDDG